jgi:hypothetical protein
MHQNKLAERYYNKPSTVSQFSKTYETLLGELKEQLVWKPSRVLATVSYCNFRWALSDSLQQNFVDHQHHVL